MIKLNPENLNLVNVPGDVTDNTLLTPPHLDLSNPCYDLGGKLRHPPLVNLTGALLGGLNEGIRPRWRRLLRLAN